MTLGQIFRLMQQHWPFAPGRGAVVSGYMALGIQHQHTLADIGLRNFVFSPLPETDSAIALARAEGRRQCALEIMQLAKAPPAQLQKLLETKPVETG